MTPSKFKRKFFKYKYRKNDDEEPKEGNSNQKNISLDFLNKCAIKLSKDKRLNIGEKLKIIELNKNDSIKFSIHKLFNILNISRSTINRWVKIDIQFSDNWKYKKINLPGQGKKSCFEELEKKLIEYFYQ